MLRNRCVRCDHVLEHPESMRGQEVVCPRCEALNVMRAPGDEAAQDARQRQGLERERRRFLSAIERSSEERRRPPEGSWRAPVEALPSGDLALVTARRLRDVSVYLLASAYMLLLLALAVGVVLAVWGGLPGVWRAFAFLAGTFVGVLAFIFFKFMSDTVRALADLADLGRSLEARLALLARDASPPPADDAAQADLQGEVLSGQAG